MRTPGLPIIAFVLCVVWASPVRAELWYESYEKAEAALQAEDWTGALAHLTAAAGTREDPAARARTYGMNFVNYFPYFKMGIAYYHLDKLDEATQAFETSISFGVINDSETDLAELGRYQGLVEEARQARIAAEQAQIRQIVTSNLEQAVGLEVEERFEEALVPIDTALAADPDNQEAAETKSRLLAGLSRQQEEERKRERAATLASQGRAELDAGDFESAAASLSRSLSLGEDAEVRGLLEQAQAGIRAELDRQRRQQTIADGIENASRFQAAGDFEQALDSLQPVLALDPDHPLASGMQQSLLEAQAELEKQTHDQRTVEEALAEANAAYERGEYRLASQAANRVRVVDPNHKEANAITSRAFRALNAETIGTMQNDPPEIVFVTASGERTDGSRVERLDSSEFRLRGEVRDVSVVDVVVRGPQDQAIDGVLINTEVDLENRQFVTHFSFDYELPSGSSVFTVVATDDKDLKSSLQYPVVYAVPLQRTPWPYAAGVIVLGAALYGIRFARRRNRLTRRYNPYVTGAPILKDELYFGRERLLDHVLQRIHVNSVLLYGERRIGKTSFQHRLKRRLETANDPEYAFYPIYVDLQGTAEERFFATLGEDAFQELAPHLDGLEPSAALQNGMDYNYRAFVSDIRKIINTLKRKHKKKTVKVVLQLDEVDELNTYDPRVNQKLRSLFMKTFAENLVAVVSGVGIKKQWEREGSPWYNFFQEIPVKPFRREDAEKLIRLPIQGVFDLENGVIDEILKTTDTKPYQIQKFCAVLVNRAHEEHRRRILVEDVEAVRALTAEA